MVGLTARMGRLRGGDGPTASDARLLEQARGGDRGAFDELVRRHFAEVYGLLHRLVGNHEDAEDLAQETFVRAYRSLGLYRGEGVFAAWLGRIAVHLARDHHRSRSRQVRTLALELVEAEPAARRSGELSQRELVRRVGEAVAALPPGLRAALVLRVLEGRDYEDVARSTGLKPGTVRTQVMKARRHLLRSLRPWLGEGER